MQCALLAWGVFLTTELTAKIDAFLHKAVCLGYSSELKSYQIYYSLLITKYTVK